VAGRLKCKEPLPPNAADAPLGSYLSSCHGCAVTADVLSCSCVNGSGEAFDTSIDLSDCGPEGISNQEGSLQCSPAQAGRRATAEESAETSSGTAGEEDTVNKRDEL